MPVVERSPLTDPGQRRGREQAFIAACVVVTVAAFAGAALLLTGGTDKPTVRPSPPPVATSSSPAATVTSPPTPEDLAATAAEARYRDFVRVKSQVGQGGYRTPQLYDTVAIRPERTQLLLEAQRFASQGARVIGHTEIASLTVQAVTVPADPVKTYPEVRLVACLDVSKVDVVDRRGQSIVAADRPTRIRSEVLLQKIPPGAFTEDRKRSGWFVTEVTQPGQSC